MNWSDIPRQPSARVLRQFAALWLAALGLLAWRLGWVEYPTPATSVLAALALAVGLLGLVRPASVRWPFLALTVLTFPVGWAVSNLVLAVLYYGVFTPLALSFRLAGRDALQLRPPAGGTSYWAPRAPTADPARYFRQF